MRLRRSAILLLPLALFGVASPMLVSCGDKPPPAVVAPVATAAPRGLETCDELRTGNFDEIPFIASPDAASRLKGLLGEANHLMQASVALEQELIDACTVLAKGAGAFDEELKASPSMGHGAEKVCGIAAAKVTKLLQEAKDAKVGIVLDLDKTQCFAPVEPMKRCLADCGSPATKGDDRVSCHGELYKTCRGRCSGACANEGGDVSGACWGVCTGKCDKEFRGACGGKCKGTCNGTPTGAPRRCVGICDGSCSDKGEGVCGGRCDGACAGLWEPREAAKCSGICTGVCGGEAGPPVCTGEFTPPGADALCLARCTAADTLVVACNAPLVRATLKGGKQTAAIQKLMTGIQAALPRILRVQEGSARRLPHAMDLVSAAAIEWSNGFSTAGPKPLSCVRAGIDGMKDGIAGIDVAVKGSEVLRPLLQPLVKAADPPPPADQ